MTVLRMEKRLSALEAKSVAASQSYDHLTDEELETLLEDIRAQILEQFAEHRVELPAEWDSMTDMQRDRWADAKVKEMGL
jgi:hypothetical protein